MMSRSLRSRSSRRIREAALTTPGPFVDVVFLLMVFFLAMDFRQPESKLKAYLPKERGSSHEPPIELLPIRIVMDAWGTEVPRRGTSPDGGPNAQYRLEGHRCHWFVGPRECNELDELRAGLANIFGDPSRRVPDKGNPGGTKPMSIVVEPGPGATLDDVVAVMDVARSVGFQDIFFGGGRDRSVRSPR